MSWKKLDEAEAASSALDGKAREKAEKDLEKLRKKLQDDTRKAIAPPTKFGKDATLGARVLPEGRGRQPRTFPVAHPRTPRFAFVWPDARPTASTVDAIEGLLARIVRIGHSSSQVHVHIASESTVASLRDPKRRFRPDETDGDYVIRWVDKGQVARLCEGYDRHRETEPRVMPARFVRYTHRAESERARIVRSIFDDELIVLERIDGPRLPITSVAGLARQVRRALMACADQPVATIISGHHPDGSASDTAHLAIVPLPFVGHRHADGSIMGIGLILPREVSAEQRKAVARALLELEKRAGGDEPHVRINLAEAPLRLRRSAWEPSQRTLQAGRWTRAARAWATATPIALDRNPGDLHDPDPSRRRAAFDTATESVVQALARIGLPAPVEIDVVRSCVLLGTAKPRTYPRFPVDTAKTQRVLVHARLLFAEPVNGPVLIGAGRFQGLGLCLPLPKEAP